MSETAVADRPETQQKDANPKPCLPFINRSNASEIGKLGAQAKIKRELETRQALASALAELEVLRPLVQKQIAKPSGEPATNEDLFRITQLARTRKLLESLYSDFETTNDAKERKFISDSIARLSDVEFALARRPKPAAYRTAPEKPKRPGQQSGPVDAD